MKRLLAHASELCVLDTPVVLAGDYNIVPTDADIYPSKSYAKNALVQPAPARCSAGFSIALRNSAADIGVARRSPPRTSSCSSGNAQIGRAHV